MKISVISFTEQGKQLASQLRESLKDHEVRIFQKPEEGLIPWAKKQFENKNALVFVGACGIAVRAIAPFVKDKLTDSPVLVMDEKGQYVIPILSGHMGGANELADLIACRMHLIPVITTATDIHHKFSVDLFAKQNDLHIINKGGIAKISAKVLRDESVTISIDGGSDRIPDETGRIPEGLQIVPYPPQTAADIVISSKEDVLEQAVLKLKPKEYILGIGCKKGKSKEDIGTMIKKCMEHLGISVSDIAAVASIDRKKNETGICQWTSQNRIPFVTFSEEELRRVKGNFHSSDFVKQTVGVDNVCERAALAACGEGGTLVLAKQAENGITIAAAKRIWTIEWAGGKHDEA